MKNVMLMFGLLLGATSCQDGSVRATQCSQDPREILEALVPLTGDKAEEMLAMEMKKSLQLCDISYTNTTAGSLLKEWIYKDEIIRAELIHAEAFSPLSGVRVKDISSIELPREPVGHAELKDVNGNVHPSVFDKENRIFIDSVAINNIYTCLSEKSTKVTSVFSERLIKGSKAMYSGGSGKDDGSRGFSGVTGILIRLTDGKSIFLVGDIATGEFSGFLNASIRNVLQSMDK